MTDTIFVQLDHYVSITPGQPFRLFPFGTIVKNGTKHEITPEIAAAIKLPHFKPPIKLGGHRDELPAGGFIAALEVRHDGLYAIPEWNEAGLRALNEGAYRYHSPEIIWDGIIEDSASGIEIEGTIIMGAALLHTPALGEAAAFFETTVNTKGDEAMSDTVTLPVSWLDKLFNREPEAQPEPTEPQRGQAQPDEFAAQVDEYKAQAAAAQKERDEFAAKIEKLEAERAHADRVAQFSAQLAETNLKGDDEFAATLAALDDEQASIIVQRVKALSAQADQSLEGDVGASGDGSGGDKIAAFEALVQDKIKDGMTRSAAYAAAIADHPDVYGEAVNHG